MSDVRDLKTDWFKYPLHGVVCRPWSQAPPLKHELNVTEVTGLQNSGQLIWQGQQLGDRYNTQITLFRDGDAYTLDIDCQGKGVFRLDANQFDIDWQASGTPASHYFQSMGLALWLELQGTLCLHGNALTKDERTVVLIAPSGTGKSTLSSVLLQQGYELLTDDMVALYSCEAANTQINGYEIYPSWPVVRLWPDSIEHVLADTSDLRSEHTKVHNAYEKKLVPLQRPNDNTNKKMLTDIILLKRQDNIGGKNEKNNNNRIETKTLSGGEAFMALLKNTILGEVYRPLGIEDQRLIKLAEISQNIRVTEITYPSGTHGLQAVSKWFAA